MDHQVLVWVWVWGLLAPFGDGMGKAVLNKAPYCGWSCDSFEVSMSWVKYETETFHDEVAGTVPLCVFLSCIGSCGIGVLPCNVSALFAPLQGWKGRLSSALFQGRCGIDAGHSLPLPSSDSLQLIRRKYLSGCVLICEWADCRLQTDAVAYLRCVAGLFEQRSDGSEQQRKPEKSDRQCQATHPRR